MNVQFDEQPVRRARLENILHRLEELLNELDELNFPLMAIKVNDAIELGRVEAVSPRRTDKRDSL